MVISRHESMSYSMTSWWLPCYRVTGIVPFHDNLWEHCRMYQNVLMALSLWKYHPLLHKQRLWR